MTSTRAEVLASLEIRRDDFVVEVGGGHEPCDRSDVIFDKYPFDNLHRSQDLVHAAPVLIADAACLPLPDAGCDLLFASHIIEHLSDPGGFLQEVARCSRRVYLEFPSAHRELLFAWSFHEWLVEVEGTQLSFYRNDIPQLFGELFHANYDFLLDGWMAQRHLKINTHVACESAALTWRVAGTGAFEHLVSRSARGRDRRVRAPLADVEYTWRQIGTLGLQRLLPPRWFDALVRAVRRRRRGSPKRLTQVLVDRLACPACGAAALRLAEEHIACTGCGSRYRRRGGLFDFDRPCGALNRATG